MTIINNTRGRLIESFLTVVKNNPDRPAVVEAGRSYSYIELLSLVYDLYLATKNRKPSGPIGLYAGRSILSYAGMWAAIFLGLPYVPLNPSFPKKRLQQIISQCDLNMIICEGKYREVLEALVPGMQLCCCDTGKLSAKRDIDKLAVPKPIATQDMAYILFTSGSTGMPKGVPVSYANLLAFITNVNKRIKYRPSDRVAQVCETSFDVSGHEIYLALLNGASLHPARSIDLFNPVQYIQKNKLTVWHSVPTLANVAVSSSLLKEGCLDSLRISIFNGESLTKSLAGQWQKAASSGQIWNFYGPTECTVAVSCEQFSNDDTAICSGNNIAIGSFFDGCDCAILNDGVIVQHNDFSDGMNGELLISGIQTFDGYIGQNFESPFIHDKDNKKYYRTGDLVCWKNHRFFVLGRNDHQVKIGGHRIELMEVEHELKDFFKTELLAVLAFPEDKPNTLLLCSEVRLDLTTIMQNHTSLPKYMIPGKSVFIETLPKNQSGKIDRKALMLLVNETL